MQPASHRVKCLIPRPLHWSTSAAELILMLLADNPPTESWMNSLCMLFIRPNSGSIRNGRPHWDRSHRKNILIKAVSGAHGAKIEDPHPTCNQRSGCFGWRWFDFNWWDRESGQFKFIIYAVDETMINWQILSVQVVGCLWRGELMHMHRQCHFDLLHCNTKDPSMHMHQCSIRI